MQSAISQQQYPRASGGVIVPPSPTTRTRQQIIDLIVQKATDNGLVPYEFLAGAIAESGLDPLAYRDGPWPDKSPGLFQQTIKFADEGDHTDSPENIALIKRLYFDPAYACDVAAIKYKYWRYNPDVPALTAWVAYNGPSFYHTPESSPNVNNYRSALTRAQAMLGSAPVASGSRLYVSDVPDSVIRQQNDWSCAVRSTYAALWSAASLGKIEPVTYGDGGPRDVYDWMVPGLDDPAVGLHDHTGSGLAAMLRERGINATSASPVLLADVQERAGLNPMMIGGRGWNHWVCVNGVEDDGTLILENPAPGYAGVSDILRDSFGRLGPFSMVWLDV